MLGAVARICPFVDPDAVKRDDARDVRRRYAHLVDANLRTFDRGYQELRLHDLAGRAGRARPATRSGPRLRSATSTRRSAARSSTRATACVKNLSTSRQGFLPAYDLESCVHCGICDIVCPDLCFVWSRRTDDETPCACCGIDYHYCKGCLKCIDACPTGSLTELREEDG